MIPFGRLVSDIVERSNKEQAAFWAKVGRDAAVTVERVGQLAQAIAAQAVVVPRDVEQKPPSE